MRVLIASMLAAWALGFALPTSVCATEAEESQDVLPVGPEEDLADACVLDADGENSIDVPVDDEISCDPVYESTVGESADEPTDVQQDDTLPLEAQDGGSAPRAADSNPTPELPETPKDAIEVEEGTYVIQAEVAPDRVMDAAGVNPVEGAAVATWAYNGGGNQAWDVERDDSGWYRLVVHHAASNERLCLGLKRGTCDTCLVREGAEGVSLRQLLWSFVAASGESVHLVNAAYPGKSLDVYGNSPNLGARFILWDTKNDKSKNQNFLLCERYPDVAPSDAEIDGTYNLVLSGQDRMVDVDNARRDNGANVLLWRGNGGRNQRICLEEDGTGYHVCWVLDSGKVLDVAGESVLRDTNVLQWEYKGSSNQKWAVRKKADGSFMLQNKGTGLVLGVHSTALGANVVGVGEGDASARTGFALKEASLVDAGVCVMRSRSNTQLVLDVDHASTGSAGVLLWLDTGSLNQRFEMVPAERDHTWRVRTASSGGWLTLVKGALRQEGNGSTPESSANTWQAQWHKGAVVLVNVGTGLAMDPINGKAQLGTFIASAPAGAEAAQRLIVDPAPLLGAGCYFFGNDHGKYLEVAGLSTADGANVQVGERSGSYGQLFRIEPSGNTCRIVNVLSGKALEASGTSSMLNVAQRGISGSALQLWTMRIADGGHVRFESAANRAISLDAWDGGAAPTNVGTYSNNTSTAQSWRPISLPPENPTPWQSRAVSAAHSTPSTAGGLCALWVSNVFRNAGIGSWNGDARDLYSWYCHSNDLTALRPGMIVAVSSHSHTWAGSIWGHVCVYIGNGMIMDSVGQKRTMALSDWAAWYGDRVTVRWGWMGNRAL